VEDGSFELPNSARLTTWSISSVEPCDVDITVRLLDVVLGGVGDVAVVA
jgi:hypothetical protein